MGKIPKTDWHFRRADSLDKITDALLWELTRTNFQECPKFKARAESINRKNKDIWPMNMKEWPAKAYFFRKRKTAHLPFSMFGETVNLWSIRKPDVLARLIVNLRLQKTEGKEVEIVGLVENSPALAMNESLGYGVSKVYVNFRYPTPELLTAFENIIRQGRLKHMPDICDSRGNLKKGKGFVKTEAGLAELINQANLLLHDLGIYRAFKDSQESVTQTLDWMVENNLSLVDEKTIRGKIKVIKTSLKSISDAYLIPGG